MDKYQTTLSHAKAHLQDMGRSQFDPVEFGRYFSACLSSSRAAVQYAFSDAKQLDTDKALQQLCNEYTYIVAFKGIRGHSEHVGPVPTENRLIEREYDIVAAKEGSEVDHPRWQETDFDPWPEIEVLAADTMRNMDYQLIAADLAKYGLSNEYNLIGHCSAHIDAIERMLVKARKQGLIP
ncbi:Uncharacterised protein [Ectopseudomonas mendocina]|uniref:Uncharacterized protein n=1 Tax=Ectopseudomonas mendocina TaxID=300 RepID=A0A379IMV9_ECTME|nr:hypothetical protein [Pseudomonas mendocina]SUD37619.1 Uncharacterised protein [Pseudomonas mendocina]